MFVRSGDIPSHRQTSIDKNNDCIMKSERGARLRGSDPPSGRSVYETSGNTWWASARRLIQTHLFGRCCVHNRRYKFSIPLRWQKVGLFFRFGRIAWDAAGNFSPPRPRIHLISSGPSSTFTGLAGNESGWQWVDFVSRLKTSRRVSCF